VFYLHFLGICRSKHGQRVTGGKIVYVRKSRRLPSKKSSLKRVHLLFDDDGNAVNADNEGRTLTQRVKSFLQEVKNDCTNQRTSNRPLLSDEPVADSLETVCSTDDQNVCSDDKTTNTAVVNSAQSRVSSVTSGAADAGSSCQGGTWTTAVSQSRDCCDAETEDNVIVSDSEAVVSTSCSVASVAASCDAELSKYWWQRYRLFSRFDSGIMIDRG